MARARAKADAAPRVLALLPALVPRRLPHGDLLRLRAVRAGRRVQRQSDSHHDAADHRRADQLAHRAVDRPADRPPRRAPDADDQLQRALVVFLGFALAGNVWLLFAFYLGYNFLFTFSIGTTTYLRKIARTRGHRAERWRWASPGRTSRRSACRSSARRSGPSSATSSRSIFGTVFVMLSLYFTQKIDVLRQKVTDPAPATLQTAPVGAGRG